jgi:flagellar export protein FliJ
MCAFKFRLEPVVSLKKKLEDERKTALAEAKKDLQHKENLLVNLCEHQEACQSEMGDEMRIGALDISRKLVFYAYLERLADEISDHTVAIEKSKDDVETKRDLLLESSREKKALENLKQRMKERYVRRAKKLEQAILDDTAGQLHGRKADGKLIWKKE